MSATVLLRLEPTALTLVDALARRQDKTRSDWLRTAIYAAIEEQTR